MTCACNSSIWGVRTGGPEFKPLKDEIRNIVKERKRRRNEGRNEEGFRKKHWASGKDFSE